MLPLKNIYTTLKNVIIIVIAILCTVGMTTFVSLIKSAMANTPTFTIGSDPIIDITGTGQGLSLGDDNMSGMKNIGFDFTFYNQTFDQVNISMNGFFTFQDNFSVSRSRNYRSETLPATSFNYSVFPAWSDYIRRSSGNKSPYIQTFGQTADTDQYFVIMWDNVSEYSNGLKSTFQAILYETTNEISFRYDELRIQNHDLTIGVQGNNEAVTYLRYEDNNSSTYVVTDDFSLTTAEVIDESFSNLSSECLIDADFSELCDVYDLTNSFEEEEDYLYGAGLTDSMLFGYDEEEDFYGFHEDETNLYGREVVFEDVSYGHIGSDDYDATISITDIILVEEYNLEDEHISLDDDFNFTDDFFVPDLENIDFIPLEDITDTEVIDIFEIHIIDREEEFIIFIEEELTEEQMEEIEEHFEEHFEEEFMEEEFEQFAETREELFDEEEAIEEEEELLDESIDEITPEEVEDEDKPRKRNRVRSIVASTNALLERINPNITGGTTSQSSSTISVSSNTSGASTSPMSISSSPSMSDQIASSQAQTNTILQSINIVPMPSVGSMPSTVMAEVQVTTMDSQKESMTSTMVTASEADQIADQIVASNIRAQQQESQQQEQESGTYDTAGQATLLAYMNYLPGFTSYTDMAIPDQSNWYEPRTMYAQVTMQDNVAAYGELVSNSMNTLGQIIEGQPSEFFNRRLR